MSHLFKVTENIGLVATGVLGAWGRSVCVGAAIIPARSPAPADARAVVQHARRTAAEFEFDNGYPIPVAYLAKKLADENQVGSGCEDVFGASFSPTSAFRAPPADLHAARIQAMRRRHCDARRVSVVVSVLHASKRHSLDPHMTSPPPWQR